MSTKPDPKKVSTLKDKVRREQDPGTPNSGGDINSVLYGAQNDNQPAAGAGEFNA